MLFRKQSGNFSRGGRAEFLLRRAIAPPPLATPLDIRGQAGHVVRPNGSSFFYLVNLVYFGTFVNRDAPL